MSTEKTHFSLCILFFVENFEYDDIRKGGQVMEQVKMGAFLKVLRNEKI